MNNIVRERLVEITTTAAITAVLVTSITFGIFFSNKRESDRVAREMLPIAEKGLVMAGNRLVQRGIPIRGMGFIRRAFVYENKDGKTVGAGFSIWIDTFTDGIGLFVITDEKGRIRSTGAWPGVSGIRAEELQTYLKQREKGSTGGLVPAADIQSLEYSVNTAMDEAGRFMRSWEGSKK